MSFSFVKTPLASETLFDNAENKFDSTDIQSAIEEAVQKQRVRVVNKLGSTVTAGTVVYINGAQGNRPTIGLADADNATADRVIGVVAYDIENNDEGCVVVSGPLSGIDTSGWSVGVQLYVSTNAGELTDVPPLAPKHQVQVGYTLNSTNNGSILVAIQNAGDLYHLHDVSLGGLTDGHVLTWNATDEVWENKAPSASGDHSTLSGLTTGDAGHTQFAMLAGRAGGQTINGGTAASESLNLNSTANATKGAVNINGQHTFDHTQGTLTVGSTADWGYDARINILGNAPPLQSLFRGIAVANVTTEGGNKGACAIVGPRKTTANEPFSVLGNWDNGTARIAYIGGGGWGMPDATQVNFYAASAYDETLGTSASLRAQLTYNTLALQTGVGFTCPGDATFGATALSVDTTNNRIGVGKVAGSAIGEFEGAAQFGGALRHHIATRDTASQAANCGSGIVFQGRYVNSSTAQLYMGGIGAYKENSTSANTACYLAMYSRPAAQTPVEVARITSTGKMGVGTKTPSDKLTVSGAAAADGSDPVSVSVESTTSSDSWTAGSEVTSLKFASSDTSGNGAGARSKIAMHTDDTTGSSYSLSMATDSGSGLIKRALVTDTGLTLPKASGAGIKVDTASPTYGWKDLTSEVTVKGQASNTTPTWSVFRNGIYAYQFSVNDECWLQFHIPHDYLPGSDLFIHAHWSHASTGVTSGGVTWGFETTYAKGHGQAAFPATVIPTIYQAASTTQYQHMVAEVQLSAASPSANQIDSDDIEVDGVILVRCYLSANTMNGTTEPFMYFCDIHYQSTQLATKNKAPNFYT